MRRARLVSIQGGGPARLGRGPPRRAGAAPAKLGFALAWLLVGVDGVGAAAHHYTRAERYAGCLFGETIPLMRRGAERERALGVAASRCAGWGEGLPPVELRAVEAEARRAVERLERRGL